MPKLFHLVLNPKAIEYYQEILDYLKGRAGFRYILVTKHIPHEGQNYEHYHIAVQYKNSILLDAKQLHGAHNEAAEKSIQANVRYCKCEDKKHKQLGVTYELIHEDGEIKPRGGDYSVKHLLEIENKEDLPDARMYNTWKKLKLDDNAENSFYEMLESIKNNTLKPIEVVYIIGEPGEGKTYNGYLYALSKYENIKDITKLSIENNFFEFTGKSTAKCLVVEEFRQSQLHPTKLLQFTDKYGYKCSIKGSYAYTKPETIIISSIIHPAELYSENHQELNKQFTRRISKLFKAVNHELIELDLTIEFPDLYKDNDSTLSNVSHDTECLYCTNKCNFFDKN